jgi:hypothetical protein
MGSSAFARRTPTFDSSTPTFFAQLRESSFRFLLAVDRAATFRRAAPAANLARFCVEFVIVGQLFPALDPASAEQEDVAADDSLPQIRIAAVIDEFGAAASDGAVNHPAAIQFEEVSLLAGFSAQHGAVAADRLALGDSLAGVLDNFSIRGDRLGREDSAAMDARAADAELETGVARVNARCDSRRGGKFSRTCGGFRAAAHSRMVSPEGRMDDAAPGMNAAHSPQRTIEVDGLHRGKHVRRGVFVAPASCRRISARTPKVTNASKMLALRTVRDGRARWMDD